MRKKRLSFFLLFHIPNRANAALKNEEKDTKKTLSAFPILMYDTDIGVGYGGKAKFVNYLSKKESFDFTVFNSSKGERWYVFTFSIPDIEIRLGMIWVLVTKVWESTLISAISFEGGLNERR